MSQIEAAAREMQANGSCDAWFEKSTSGIKKVVSHTLHLCLPQLLHVACHKVSNGVNGPIMELLAAACQYHDADCIEMFRSGGQLFGKLPAVGNGVSCTPETQCNPDLVKQGCSERNEQVYLLLACLSFYSFSCFA